MRHLPHRGASASFVLRPFLHFFLIPLLLLVRLLLAPFHVRRRRCLDWDRMRLLQRPGSASDPHWGDERLIFLGARIERAGEPAVLRLHSLEEEPLAVDGLGEPPLHEGVPFFVRPSDGHAHRPPERELAGVSAGEFSSGGVQGSLPTAEGTPHQHDSLHRRRSDDYDGLVRIRPRHIPEALRKDVELG